MASARRGPRGGDVGRNPDAEVPRVRIRRPVARKSKIGAYRRLCRLDPGPLGIGGSLKPAGVRRGRQSGVALQVWSLELRLQIVDARS